MTDEESIIKDLTHVLDGLDTEIIDGKRVADYVDMVDLDIAFSPVLRWPGDTTPVEALKTYGKNYILMANDRTPLGKASPDELRRMRARFLLQRDAYYKWLCAGGLPYSERERVIAQFFGGSVFIPKKAEAAND